MNKLLLAALFITSLTMSCTRPGPVEQYISFPDSTWYRFNKMNFELPVKPSEKAADIILFARVTREFPYGTLEFNMILDDASGEERIKEGHLNVKDADGNFKGRFEGDSCYLETVLVRNFRVTEKGMMRIELENLVPRLKTPGLLGVGIRVDYSR
jgi:gliding motility-associated lipoprotein GldH